MLIDWTNQLKYSKLEFPVITKLAMELLCRNDCNRPEMGLSEKADVGFQPGIFDPWTLGCTVSVRT